MVFEMKWASLALLIAATTDARAIDFSPALSVKNLEGYSVRVLTFAAGDGRVSYRPPPKWTSAGSPEQLTLTPPQPEGAAMKFLALKWSPEQTARLATPADEQKWALRFLPPGITEARLTATNESPFMLGLHVSREWIVEYRIEEIPYCASISRCDISPRERIIVLITCETKNFNSFRQDGIASLFSWEG
jgi:hypothetical protein